ncbi:PREDICTED: tetraspanin-32 [Myotis davidii]|uniref:tetraspanin-32 n=1 Tax=Myotis davidii TaxID=225400 RepID=UPI000767A60F|nr:PREDICTED: tetraspanin-32 [Myotis davidii]
MGPRSRVRVAKCQMLVTSLFVLLLGLLVATMAALTYFGAHFAVFSRVSPEGSSYPALHRGAFFAGISLAGLLTLGAVLSAAATVREAGGLMAGGFLCFALVFCALVQGAFWRLRNPTQVEDALPRGRQPQEPGFFRRSGGSPALRHLVDLRDPRGPSGDPRLLQDN